ncbi:MAG TPA: hypothetical protein VM490_04465 [Armatimonadaceae bacterium]|jgi:hypothetical protein|nr:hypothetical protein [Armatimonadaceae bacterium]
MKRNSPWKIVGILAALAALLGALAVINSMNNVAPGGVPGAAHDHDGDGKSDH